ncbi:MAG: UDP-N-acetylmuramoyl-L-alanyl-D-glutamate--2,6-diaminopimelate ligase [Ignavibacteria bacterium]
MRYSLLKRDNLLQSDFREDFEVKGLSCDSRKVSEGFIFFAVEGYKEDGNRYIQDAINKGARAIISGKDISNDIKGSFPNTDFVTVPDVRKSMALISNYFYSYPSESLHLIGVTGTNGKTTISYLIQSILEESGRKCGLIGTVNYFTGKEEKEASLTTPDAVDINKMLRECVDYGLQYCVMEVSSIALVLDRVYGQRFSGAIFTNLTSEHLDLHQNMQNYFMAKKILFDMIDKNGIVISNKDDSYGVDIVRDTSAGKVKFYSINNNSDYQAIHIRYSIDGLSFELNIDNKKEVFESKLSGKFNIYNILAATAYCYEIGVDLHTIRDAVKKFKPVRGRFNRIKLPNGAFAIIDYSHTSDSLKNAIESANEIIETQPENSRGRVITIFGCGGNKDRTKRPVMGKYAVELSDYVIITSDNPRFEEPMAIIKEIESGIEGKNNYEIEPDREIAIKKGLEMSQPNDLILICGKGHETYQEIKGVKYPFDDAKIVEKYKTVTIK